LAIPVAERGRLAADPEATHLAFGRVVAVGVDDAAVDEARAFGNVDEVDAGMMQHGAVARLELDDLREAIFIPRHFRIEHLHAELAFGGNLELDRHLEHHVGLGAVRPAGGVLRWRGHVGRVAARRAGINPRRDGVDLLRRQAGVVAHRQRLRHVGAPGRHLARYHLRLDRLGPRPRVFVGEQRHRRHFTGPMARGALGEHDRRHILGECRR